MAPPADASTSPPPRVPPAQLALRFALEVGALIALGRGARHLLAARPAWLAWTAAIAVPLLAAAAWATFAVRDDPSRSGRAPVPVPGAVRLAVELAILVGGLAALAAFEPWGWAAGYGAGLILHHAGTTPRLAWLLRR